MQGSRMIDTGGITSGITISCASPKARGLIGDIMAAWKKLRAGLDPDYEPTPYAFTYWLVRWSGLVQPVDKPTVDKSINAV